MTTPEFEGEDTEWERTSTGEYAASIFREFEKAALKTRIFEALRDHPEIDSSDVEISVEEDGDITVRGTVANAESRHLIERTLGTVHAVKSVRNELRNATS
jgi:osmotically-inducible protein OsmY